MLADLDDFTSLLWRHLFNFFIDYQNFIIIIYHRSLNKEVTIVFVSNRYSIVYYDFNNL